MNYTELINRIEELKSRKGRGSISADETFSLLMELAEKTKAVDINAGSLTVRRLYTSVAAMNADQNPMDQETGKPLKFGQLACVCNSNDITLADNGKVYRYNKPGWEFLRQVGDMVQFAKKVEVDSKLLQAEIVTSKKRAIILNDSQDNCLDFTAKGVTIPDGLIVYIEKIGYKISASQVLSFSENAGYNLFYNYSTNTFYFEKIDYIHDSTYNDKDVYLVCTYRGGQAIGLNCAFYKMNGESNKKIDIYPLFLYPTGITTTIQKNLAEALAGAIIEIDTTAAVLHKYEINILRKTGEAIEICAVYDESLTKKGSASTWIDIDDKLKKCVINTTNGDRITIIVDYEKIISFGAAGDLGTWLSYSCYSGKVTSTPSSLATNLVRFFDNKNPVVNPKYIKAVEAIKNFSMVSNDMSKTYRLISCKKTRSVNDMLIIYSYLEDGTRGSDIRIGTARATFLSEYVWHCSVIANGDIVSMIVDTSAVEDFVDTNSDLWFSKSTYIQMESHAGKQYCSLGASTSTMMWHKDAINKLTLDFKGLGVSGASWKGFVDTALDYSAVPVSANNCMMNQVARLFKDHSDNVYYPDVITFLCGLNDCYGVATLGTFEEAVSADLTGLTPENWFATAPEYYRVTTSISMRAALEFVSRRFPLSQIIIYTPQMTNAPSLPFDNVNSMIEVLLKVARRLSIPVIDFYHECGFCDMTGTDDIFSNDKLHPNDKGTILLSNFLKNRLKNTLCLRS